MYVYIGNICTNIKYQCTIRMCKHVAQIVCISLFYYILYCIFLHYFSLYNIHYIIPICNIQNSSTGDTNNNIPTPKQSTSDVVKTFEKNVHVTKTHDISKIPNNISEKLNYIIGKLYCLLLTNNTNQES